MGTVFREYSVDNIFYTRCDRIVDDKQGYADVVIDIIPVQDACQVGYCKIRYPKVYLLLCTTYACHSIASFACSLNNMLSTKIILVKMYYNYCTQNCSHTGPSKNYIWGLNPGVTPT